MWSVCIAALGREQDIPLVVVATDREELADEVQYENPRRKIFALTDQTRVLLAGELADASLVAQGHTKLARGDYQRRGDGRDAPPIRRRRSLRAAQRISAASQRANPPK